MKPKKLIVFDMDGVLIDVSNSYRATVRQTAGLFFSLAGHADELPEPLFDLPDLAEVKQSGGLNNDWDLSFNPQLLNFLSFFMWKPSMIKSRIESVMVQILSYIRSHSSTSCIDNGRLILLQELWEVVELVGSFDGL